MRFRSLVQLCSFMVAAWAAPAVAQAPTCPHDSIDVSKWALHDEGDFTVRLPPEYKRKEGASIDSKTAIWRAPGREIGYDYGYYSNRLTAESAKYFPEMLVCNAEGSRHNPRVIAFRVTKESYLRGAKGRYGLAGHWPRLREDTFGNFSLTFVGAVEKPEQSAELAAILRTVSFKP